ncbi:hypothetical protein HanPI659440_Chr03g0126211 [Helianthus annuus]|nr:hypothetical protein HanPI659440_Chr03g0126211 [Helianthus annuus]
MEDFGRRLPLAKNNSLFFTRKSPPPSSSSLESQSKIRLLSIPLIRLALLAKV